MTGQTVKLAAAQMLVEGGAVSRNLRRAARMIEAAAAQGCQVITLPECLDVGWTHSSASKFAAPIPGPRTHELSKAAAAGRILVCAGLTERDGNVIYNAAVLIGPDGRLLLKYRKINELDVAHDLYEIGDRLAVADTAMGRIGINICADNFPNSLDIGRTLGRMGARLLLSPSAWAVAADHDNAAQPYGGLWLDAYGQLAKAFRMPIVGASNVGPVMAGPWAGRKCIGCSLIVDAQGQVAARGPYDEESLVVADLEIVPAQAKGTSISGTL